MSSVTSGVSRAIVVACVAAAATTGARAPTVLGTGDAWSRRRIVTPLLSTGRSPVPRSSIASAADGVSRPLTPLVRCPRTSAGAAITCMPVTLE